MRCIAILLMLIPVVVSADADLVLQLSDAPDPVTLGQDVNYMILISNVGPADAKDLELSDTLPNGMTFEAITAGEEWSCTTPQLGVPGVITCRLAALVANQSSTVMIVVKPIAIGVVSNTATVTNAEPDPDGSNNQVSEETTVIAGKGEPHGPGM